MPTDNQQNQDPQLPDAEIERKNAGLEKLAGLATGAELVIGGIVKAGEKKAAEISQSVALRKQQDEALRTGAQIVGTGILQEAEKAKAEIQNKTENTAKETYNKMLEQKAKEEERKAKQKTTVSVKAPKPTSVITDVASSVMGPSDMPELFFPGATFLKDAITKII